MHEVDYFHSEIKDRIIHNKRQLAKAQVGLCLAMRNSSPLEESQNVQDWQKSIEYLRRVIRYLEEFLSSLPPSDSTT